MPFFALPNAILSYVIFFYVFYVLLLRYHTCYVSCKQVTKLGYASRRNRCCSIMFDIYIDGTAVSISTLENFSLLQHCEIAEVDLPRFCYHDQLSIAGNCRMCIVEVDGIAKPVISCSTDVHENMSVYTKTLLVKQAREFVLEFVLINHPLDCPICDQGGECDLQDITVVYGRDASRYTYVKRGVSDKLFGPLIKTVMTRCIHCTRCIRFFDEVVGSSLVGTLGRGSDTEVSTLLSKYSSVQSEINGNVIDLCPVGALTSKPYAFTNRVWELVSTESIDIFDSLCSNIRIESRGAELTRILPRLNLLINKE